MNRNALISKKESLEQKREDSMNRLDDNFQAMKSTFNEVKQEHKTVIVKNDLGKGVAANIQKQDNDTNASIDKINNAQSNIDVNDPNTEVGEVNNDIAHSRLMVNNVRTTNFVINQLAPPQPDLDRLTSDLEFLFEENNKLAQEHINNVVKLIEVNTAIQQLDNEQSSSQIPEENNKGKGREEDKDTSSVSSDKNSDWVKVSGSLIDDFADPNLEQPSYTDPED